MRRMTIRRLMVAIAVFGLVLSPVACYVNASPRGREVMETVARLVGGLGLALFTVTVPYLAGFAEEMRKRRTK